MVLTATILGAFTASLWHEDKCPGSAYVSPRVASRVPSILYSRAWYLVSLLPDLSLPVTRLGQFYALVPNPLLSNTLVTSSRE